MTIGKTELFFPNWFPEKKQKRFEEKPIAVPFIEILCDKNNIKFKTTRTNSCFEEYPEKTNILCGWCRHSFESRPIGIPIKKIKDIYWMEGCFCSFNCCLAFLNDHFEKHKERQDPLYINSIFYLKDLFASVSSQELKPASDWRLLEKVSTGSMTIEQFRADFHFNRTSNVKFSSAQIYYQMK